MHPEEHAAIWSIVDIGDHCRAVKASSKEARKQRLLQEMDVLVDMDGNKPAEKQRNKRNQDAGIWLSLIPTRLNGNNLLAEEFRDNLRLCYNYTPLDIQQCCDGCGAKISVGHILAYKVGRMVHMQHDNVANKLGHLCGTALSYGKVEHKPQIYACVSRRTRVDSDTPLNGTQPTPQSHVQQKQQWQHP